MAGRREQPPTSGSSPTLTSMIPAIASSAITRKSAARASSNAPPRQAPWIWQMVGLGISSSRFHQARIGPPEAGAAATGFSDRSRRSLRSMPDENMAPSPRTTTHAHGGVVGRRLERVAEARDQLAVEGVALLGTLEDQVADPAAILDSDQ